VVRVLMGVVVPGGAMGVVVLLAHVGPFRCASGALGGRVPAHPAIMCV